jgi:Putative bacterial sensory transduction regulator
MTRDQRTDRQKMLAGWIVSTIYRLAHAYHFINMCVEEIFGMQTKLTVFIAIAVTVFFSSSASADSKCPDGLVCASAPETVVKAMQEAGFRAKLDKDKTGDPLISSEASSYAFDIFFYGCENSKNCTSLQFQTSFGAEEDNTPEYANAWNTKYRFVQASVKKKNFNWRMMSQRREA